MIKLRLADGRVATASPGHPVIGGRGIEQLKPGNRYDGSKVIAVDRRPYAGAATFDILVSGETGIYWADGVPVQSTLGKP